MYLTSTNNISSVFRKLSEQTASKASGPTDNNVDFVITLDSASGKESLKTDNVHAAQVAEISRLNTLRKTLSGRNDDCLVSVGDTGFHDRLCSQTPESQNIDVLPKVAVNYSVARKATSVSPSIIPPGDISMLIARASMRYGVEKNLIRAVIQAESDFCPSAVSPAGAQGLMQLMPSTSSDLGVTNPFDPEQNIMAGTRFLKNMLTRYGGDIDKALAAYNWGPGNLDRKKGLLPKETQQYIAKVRHLLNENQTTSGIV